MPQTKHQWSFSLEYVLTREQICEPKLHEYCNYHSPSAASGTIKIFPVLRKPAWPLCTFVGHREAEKKIFPPSSPPNLPWNNADRQQKFVLQLMSYLTYFLLLPDCFKCHLLAGHLWKCGQLSSFAFPANTNIIAMSKVGQKRMISPKQ